MMKIWMNKNKRHEIEYEIEKDQFICLIFLNDTISIKAWQSINMSFLFSYIYYQTHKSSFVFSSILLSCSVQISSTTNTLHKFHLIFNKTMSIFSITASFVILTSVNLKTSKTDGQSSLLSK